MPANRVCSVYSLQCQWSFQTNKDKVKTATNFGVGLQSLHHERALFTLEGVLSNKFETNFDQTNKKKPSINWRANCGYLLTLMTGGR